MGLPVVSSSDGLCYMMGGERVAGTIIALFEKMPTRLGMRSKRKKMVLNQGSQTWPNSIQSCSFDWYPERDIQIEYYR